MPSARQYPMKTGMKIRAVAAPRLTRIIDIAAPPSRDRICRICRGNHVIIDRTRFLEISMCIGFVNHLLRPGPNLLIDRHQPIRFQIHRELSLTLILDWYLLAAQCRLDMLIAGCF